MKYGVVTYARNKDVNIGDSIMSLGVREVYKKMGIKEEDIVNIYYDKNINGNFQYDLEGYDGEYIILPMAMCIDFDTEHPNIFPLPPRIIPVFLGFHTITPEGWVKFFSDYKHFGPFACRDVKTMELLRKEGLEAYTIGCLSIQSVEKREQTRHQNKVYLVDVPQHLRKYIPKEILQNAIEKTHVRYINEFLTGVEAAEEELKLTRNILREYRDYAKLVITTRLHCALPCISMGIPTIVVNKERKNRENVRVFDNRFKGMDSLLNMYNSDEFDSIDWNPGVPDIEDFKKKQLEQAISMINNVYEKYNRLCDISYFLEQGKGLSYYSGTSLGYLSRKQKEDFYYRKSLYDTLFEVIIDRPLYDTHMIIYGAGDKGCWMYHKFGKEMHMAKTCIYVDNDIKKQGGSLNKFKILSPDVIGKYQKGTFVIIIASSHTYDCIAQSIDKELTEKYGLTEGKDYFMLDQLIKSGENYIGEFSMVRDWLEDVIWT